jgi:hypothetical protein
MDATDMSKFFNMVLGAVAGVTAHAGGGIPLATPINLGFTSVDTVATAADSVVLPPAIVSARCTIFNGGAASLSIYNLQSNSQTGGASDAIIPHGSAVPNAGNVAITLAVGHGTTFVCMRPGYWKQVADFA